MIFNYFERPPGPLEIVSEPDSRGKSIGFIEVFVVFNTADRVVRVGFPTDARLKNIIVRTMQHNTTYAFFYCCIVIRIRRGFFFRLFVVN